VKRPRRQRLYRDRAAGNDCDGRIVYLSEMCASNAAYLQGLAHPDWPAVHGVPHDDHWHLAGVDA
jgi:hypothetical protein